MADSGPGKWRERLVAVLRLSLPLALAPLHLLPIRSKPLLVWGGLWLRPRLVRLDIRVARHVLFDSPQVRVRRRMLYLRDTRSRMVDAAEAERRRIERDPHDGAQQRLLALSMLLTRAHAKFDQDPEQVRALLDEARSESRAVMADPREVAAPPRSPVARHAPGVFGAPPPLAGPVREPAYRCGNG